MENVLKSSPRTECRLVPALVYGVCLSRQPGGSGEAGCSGSGSSHSKSFDQLRFPPGLSGSTGDGGDSLSVTSAGSSSSDVEEVNISFISDSPDALERKVRTLVYPTEDRLISFSRSPLFPNLDDSCHEYGQDNSKMHCPNRRVLNFEGYFGNEMVTGEAFEMYVNAR